MYLKKIVLDGFKSFGDKTVFKFKPGFTVITGPNGCGKSNVVDAIKWTLGEQSPKSLRGKQMADVIFGGNSRRPMASYAQVDLYFDLQPGDMPLEGNEVIISRRLTSDGNSSYLINKEDSRLKDIRELFMDTGIGVGGYYVMEQGKIDHILNASFKERRQIFEEAAGISKFKSQKKETLRKLDRVEGNLTRLQDILSELESRLQGVRIQAGKAQKHQEYSDEIHKLKLAQAAAQYNLYQDRLDEMEGEMENLQDRLKELGEKSQDFEADLEEVTHKRKETEALLDSHQKEAISLREKKGHLKSVIASDTTFLEEMAEDRVRSQAEQEKNRRRIEELEQELADLEKELKREEKNFEKLQTQLEKKEEKLTNMEQESEDSLKELEERKNETLSLLHRRTELQNQMASLTSRKKGLEVTQNRIDDRIQESLRRERELLYQRDQKEEELEEIDEELEFLKREEESLENKIEAKREEFKSLSSSLSDHKSQLDRLESRLEVLQQLSLDDVEEGLKVLLEGKRKGDMEGVHDLLINLFTVDLEFAPALEAALGPFLYGLVVEEEDVALRARAYLKEKKAGEALLLPLDRFPEREKIALPPGVLHPSEVIRAKAPYDQLLASLLANYGITNNLPKALQLSPQSREVHLVCRTGEIVYGHGPLLIQGALSGEKKGTLAQRSELAELESRYEELKETVAEEEEKLGFIQSKGEELRFSLAETQEELSERNIMRVEAKAALEQLEEKLLDQRSQQEIAKAEWEDTQSEITEVEGEIESTQEKLDEVEKRAEEVEKEIASQEEKLAGVQSKKATFQDEITTLKVDLASSTKQLESQKNTLERMRDELADRRARESSSEEEEKSLQARRENLKEKIEENKRIKAETEQRLAYLDDSIASLEEERQRFLGEEDRIRAKGEDSYTTFQNLQEELSSLKVQRSKIEVRLEDLLEKIEENMGIDLPQVVEEEDFSDVVLEEVDQRVNELSKKLKRLGSVNFEALEELAVLEERFSRLKDQERDLLESKNSLTDIIDRLDQISRERFEHTFETVRGHFQRLFRKLFGGGKADLVLEEEEDILEAGIDIIAKPPGKEPRSITLLSGGERTMTTVALSFAIFQFKPSPFCLLDEVDAALDENNIGRFVNMLREFLEECQFIIVSHSRQTIASADVIYGVTMEESGISKNISLELKQVEDHITV